MRDAARGLVLHPYALGPSWTTRQAPTWRAWAAAEPRLRAAGWRVYHVGCGIDTAYEDTLRTVWGRGPLIICEHDIVPTAAAWAALAACPAPVCAVAYRLAFRATDCAVLGDLAALWAAHPEAQRWAADWPAHLPPLAAWFGLVRDAQAQNPPTARRLRVWAHRVRTGDPAAPERWVRTGEPWADACGFGLTRFGVAVQQRPPDWAPGTWRDLDSRVSAWLQAQGCRIHVHWPAVRHTPADEEAPDPA